MPWNNRKDEQEAVTWLLIAVLLIGSAFVSSAVYREMMRRPSISAQKLEKMREAAAIQARWEASARARKQPIGHF